jgi:hypothetical protein
LSGLGIVSNNLKPTVFSNTYLLAAVSMNRPPGRLMIVLMVGN